MDSSSWAVSFGLVAIKQSIREFAAGIRKYIRNRAARQEDARQKLVDDLRATGDIVMKLRNGFTECMKPFTDPDTVNDPKKLSRSVETAEEYLSSMKLLPALLLLTGVIKSKKDSPLASAARPELEQVCNELDKFRLSIGYGDGAWAGVGRDALQTVVSKALTLDVISEFQGEELVGVEKAGVVVDVAEAKKDLLSRASMLLQQQDTRAADAIPELLGKAIGKLGGTAKPACQATRSPRSRNVPEPAGGSGVRRQPPRP